MKKAVFGLALIIIPTTTLADMPRYDVEGHCAEVAGFGGNYSNSIFNSCFDMEQSAYNSLKARWASISGRVRSHCDNVARFGGGGSYSILESCVQMEESAGSQNKTFSY